MDERAWRGHAQSCLRRRSCQTVLAVNAVCSDCAAAHKAGYHCPAGSYVLYAAAADTASQAVLQFALSTSCVTAKYLAQSMAVIKDSLSSVVRNLAILIWK